MSDVIIENKNPMLGRDPYSVPLEDIDVSQEELYQSDTIWGFYDRLRKEDPVHFCKESKSGPFWSITKFKDIMEVESKPGIFSAEPSISIFDQPEDFKTTMFIAMDEPEHGIQRRTVQDSVAPKNLANMEGLIRERVGNILDSLPIGETFDWVDKVSVELTGQMLATLFDFPFEERRKLTYWTDVAMTRPGPDAIVKTNEERHRILLEECMGTFVKLWNERAKQPPQFDLISMMAHGKETKNMPFERPMEFMGNLMLLIIGGNDTTRNSITGSVVFLNKNPAEYKKLRENPDLVTSMVPEIIRHQTPVLHMRRNVTEDTVFRGKHIKKGDKVVMWYMSGNRDEDSIDRPYDFIIDRDKARHHLSFGMGIHRCMGNRLAEMQIRVLWEEILKRFNQVEMMGEPERVYSNLIHGIAKLPVQLHAL